MEILRRLRYYLHRADFERDLDEEMRHHLALKAEAQGMGPSFGNVTYLKEESRAMWNWNFFEQLSQDIRYAVRTMCANRLFTIAGALSLALGIGANTAIYSFMDAILMRALPVQHPEELVIFHWRAKGRTPVVHGINGTSRRDSNGLQTSPNFPYAAYESLTASHNSLSTVFAYAYTQSLNLVAQKQAAAATVVPVSGNFFGSLGIAPAAGRLIEPNDDRSGTPFVAVLSYDYWNRHFAADPSIVGQTILANNLPLTIVGVSAPDFFGLDPGSRPNLFIPLHSLPRLSLTPANEERKRFFDAHSYWVEMSARLRPGVTLEQAQAESAAQFQTFVASTATSEKERSIYPEVWLESGSSGLDSLRQQYSKPLRVLMTMVALILTIACANLANLLLGRSAARRREIAVRLSLGAGRRRIVRQLLTESLVLALLGGVLGLGFGYWGIQFITWLIANGRDNFTLHAQLNWPVMAFTIALSVVTGLVFGVAPALQATRVDLTPALKTSKAGGTRGPRRWTSFLTATRTLVTAQLAISLLLVMGAALFVRNLVNLNSIDLGFNREKLLVFTLNPREAGYKDQAVAQFLLDVHDRIRQVPGVRDVGLSSFPLVSRYVNSNPIIIPGVTQANKTYANLLDVDPDFLRTMQIPIAFGRTLETRDLSAPNAVVVNQKFASTFFGTDNPLGRHFNIEGDSGDFEIAGVARDAHYNSIEETTPAVVYIPFTRHTASLSRMFFNVRTAGDPMSVVSPIREIVHQASPTVLMSSINTESRIIDQTIGQQRTFADLGTCFAVLALLIACVGLYGAMAYAVARRTSEIGIRMALGAKRGGILWMVLREVVVLAAIGLAAGYVASRQLAKWIESFLFGMKPTDATSAALAIAILFAAALTAGFLPAWRASRIHPMTALRDE